MDGAVNPLSILGRTTSRVVTVAGVQSAGFQAMFSVAGATKTARAPDGSESTSKTDDPRAGLIDRLGVLRQQALSTGVPVSHEGLIGQPASDSIPAPDQGAETEALPGLVGSLASLVAGFDRETGAGLIEALRTGQTGTNQPPVDGFPTAGEPGIEGTETPNTEIQALVAVIGFVERVVQALPSPVPAAASFLPVRGTVLAAAAMSVPAGGSGFPGGAGIAPGGVAQAAAGLPNTAVPGGISETPAGTVGSPRSESGAVVGLPAQSNVGPGVDSTAVLSPAGTPKANPGPRIAASGSMAAAISGEGAAIAARPENPGRIEIDPISSPSGSSARGSPVESVEQATSDMPGQPRTRGAGTVATAAEAMLRQGGSPVSPKALSAANVGMVAAEVVRAGPMPANMPEGLPRDVESVVLPASGTVARSAEVGTAVPATPLASVTDPRLTALSPGLPGESDMVSTLLGQVVAQAVRVLDVERERRAESTPGRSPEVSQPPLPEFLTRAQPAAGGPGQAQPGNGAVPEQSRFATVLAAQIRAAEIGAGRTVIELSPRGLGQIEIDIRTESDGSLKVTIRADNTAVLNTLREARDLLAPSLGFADGGVLDFQEGSPGQDRRGQNGAPTPGISGDEDVAATVAKSESVSGVIGGGQLDIIT